MGNYEQALSYIREYDADLRSFQQATGYTHRDFERWHEEEKAYLANVQVPDVDDQDHIDYVRALLDLGKRQ